MILEKNAALRFLWDQTMFQELEIMVPLIQSWLAAIYRKEVYNSIYVYILGSRSPGLFESCFRVERRQAFS